MQLTAILVSALAATASAASVASRQTSRRSPECKTVPASDVNFAVADLRSGVVAKKELVFHLGPDTTGPCQLIGRFNVGFPVDQQGDEFSRLDVRGGVGSNAPGSLVGSFGPLDVENQAVVTEVDDVVINSFECKPELSFVFEIANDAEVDADISVAFTANEYNGFFVKVADQC